MSVPSPRIRSPQAHRSRFLRPIRLSTFLLLVLVIALLIGLYAQRLREAQLQDAIAVYRNYRTEAIIDALDQPIALNYADGTPLDDLLKEVSKQTTKTPKPAKPWAGIPIYVDPIGLQEAERSMNSTVKRPPSADTLTLGEHLRRVLEPLGLGYEVKDGFLMITVEGVDRRARWRGRGPLSPVSRRAAVALPGPTTIPPRIRMRPSHRRRPPRPSVRFPGLGSILTDRASP